MSGGTEQTTIDRHPGFNQFLDEIFGTQGTAGTLARGGGPGMMGRTRFLGQGFGGTPGTPGTPGTGLGGQAFEDIFGGFAAPVSPLQRQATNQLGQFLNQEAPEMQAFRLAQQGLNPIITGEGQFGNVAEALTPIFDRNLTETLGQTQASLPGVFNKAASFEVANVGQRALQDFNLFIEQARQQDIANRIGAVGALGTQAGQAGQNPFGRALAAGQFGAQQGQFEQAMRQQMQQAILQMLMGQTGQTTSYSPGFFDYLGLGAQGIGFAAGGGFGGGGG
jgi:hypothetical protein